VNYLAIYILYKNYIGSYSEVHQTQTGSEIWDRTPLGSLHWRSDFWDLRLSEEVGHGTKFVF
jgi:hypothetical protein